MRQPHQRRAITTCSRDNSQPRQMGVERGRSGIQRSFTGRGGNRPIVPKWSATTDQGRKLVCETGIARREGLSFVGARHAPKPRRTPPAKEPSMSRRAAAKSAVGHTPPIAWRHFFVPRGVGGIVCPKGLIIYAGKPRAFRGASGAAYSVLVQPKGYGVKV